MSQQLMALAEADRTAPVDRRDHPPIINRHSLSTEMFSAVGATIACENVLAGGPHAVIGVSPFNSRFSAAYLSRLIGWAARRFGSVDVVHPGEDAAALLVGTGTHEVKARRRARSQAARNVRDVESALAMTGAQLRAGRVLMFDDLRNTETYQSLFDATRSEFETNDAFREACVSMTYKAIESRRAGTATGDGTRTTVAATDLDTGNRLNAGSGVDGIDVDAAVQYVLAEMPLFLDPASMTGTASAMLCYHSPWPVAAQIFGGRTRMRVAQRCGYLLVTEFTDNEGSSL